MPELEAKLLAARRRLRREPAGGISATYIEFYDPQRYNAAATVQDNMLFGRLIYGQAQAAQRIYRLTVRGGERSLNLKAEVLAVGLEHGVGTGGRRLNPAAAAEGRAWCAPWCAGRGSSSSTTRWRRWKAAVQTRIVKALRRRDGRTAAVILIADNDRLVQPCFDRVGGDARRAGDRSSKSVGPPGAARDSPVRPRADRHADGGSSYRVGS